MRENLDSHAPALGSNYEALVSAPPRGSFLLGSGFGQKSFGVLGQRLEQMKIGLRDVYHGAVFGLGRGKFWEKARAVTAENNELSDECQ